MGKKVSLIFIAVLLAGCAGGGTSSSQPDQSPLSPEKSTDILEPVADTSSEPVFVDDPDSPYPMAVESWQVDVDGDGVDELVELRAEKVYVGDESDRWVESSADGMHPYTLVMTKGEAVFERPLGRDNNDGKLLYPWYYSSKASEYTDICWTKDHSGNPVLALWFDTLSAGGAGNCDVYAVSFQDGKPAFLPVPEYGIEATLDEKTMISQVTVPETGYTETLDLMEWLADLERRNREYGHDFTFEPIYNEDGTLEWPVAPGSIDGYCYAERAEEGITLRQYVWGSAHMDGMGFLVTTMSWENGEVVVLDQYFDWS